MQFDKRLFIILTFSFIIATIIGTLSHEFGHYIVAKKLGYKATIHYDKTRYGDTPLSDSVYAITGRNMKAIMEHTHFAEEERYRTLHNIYSNKQLWMTLGGMLQTLLTGTIGLLLLFSFRRSFKATSQLNWRQWAIIFIALFWLRQTANVVMWLAGYVLTKQFSYTSDEIRIALHFGLPFWLVTTITGIIGMVILCIVIFKFIPKNQRLTFISSGMAGGVAGFILWMYLLGPVLFP